MNRRHSLSAILVAGVLLIAGCSGSESAVDMSGETFTDETSSSEVVVEAADNTFKPKYIEIKKGTTVTFENVGRNVHNVLPADEGAFEPIEAEQLPAGATGSVTFDKTGDFPYYCSLHGTATKGMIGGVRVVD